MHGPVRTVWRCLLFWWSLSASLLFGAPFVGRVSAHNNFMETLARLKQSLTDPIQLIEMARHDFARGNERLPVSPEANMTSVNNPQFLKIYFPYVGPLNIELRATEANNNNIHERVAGSARYQSAMSCFL